jgi:uncharacterized protein
MPAAADRLRELHQLHQRARALRDRLTSGPKTLAARQAAQTGRQTDLETARKALQDRKLQLKKHEHALSGLETKIDELKTKLNLVRKNEEYKALQNQIAHDNSAKSKLEEEILEVLEQIENSAAAVAKLEAESNKFAAEVAALGRQIEEDAAAQRKQLQEIETAIAAAESSIPGEDRDRYRRIIARYGADALAACEDGACLGCFTSLPPQIINDLINDVSLSYCLSCGRLLYIAEPEIANTRRAAK